MGHKSGDFQYKPLDHPSWNLAAQPCGASLPDYVEPSWQSLGTARQVLHWTRRAQEQGFCSSWETDMEESS
ncbi:hypothetical protein CGRA01v4_14739 [Colletotrichum graminicola]|nr:hypothetical protein CGRA01v4_14739 [Colletotrichum graminicola]